MKRIIVTVASVTLMMGACKEKPPIINYGESKAKDTTYDAGIVPAAQPHNVLVEEYTGGACPNCPAAHELIKTYQAQRPGRIIPIAMHYEGGQQSKPYHDAVYDLRHKDASAVASSGIYNNVSALPSAGIDRVPYDNRMAQFTTTWGAALEAAIAKPDSINLTLQSNYDSATQLATVVATIEYPQTISFAHNLNLVVVQDSIIDVQEYPFNDPTHPGKNEDYDFINVLRGAITAAPLGDPILSSMAVKNPGRVIKKVYTYDCKKIAEKAVVPAKQPPFKAEHCRIIGFVTYAGTGSYRVMQATQVKMKP